MNFAQFAGYLGKDAVLAATQSGTSVLNFSIGVTVGFGDKKRTLWVSCAIWGERAEKLEEYLKKGTPVAVAGDVDFRLYETKDHRHGGELLLNVQRVTMLGGKKDSDQKHGAPADTAAPRGADKPDFDDDIPF